MHAQLINTPAATRHSGKASALTFALLSLFIATSAHAAKADDAYKAAKDAYAKLKKDESRRKFRHNWVNITKKFEAVATRYPKSDVAADALLTAGEMYSTLARLSSQGDDLTSAKKTYERLINNYARHPLADDASLALARLLSDRMGDPAAARKVLEAAPTTGDKKREIKSLLGALPEAAKPIRFTLKADEKQKEPPPSKKDLKPVAKEKESETVVSATAAILAKISKIDVPTPPPEPPPATPEPKRAPPAAPAARTAAHDEEVTETTDEVVEPEAHAPLAMLQERLRDVRVGSRPAESGSSSTTAKSRLQTLAKTEEDAELSLAQQLGLKVKRVIIDAGHGGHDTGAIGPGGTYEKDAALAIALKLQAKLESMGLEVLLTRDDDSFVKLEDRTKFANGQKGDLFISVHCNAAPSKTLRGIETYTLNTSSNRYSVRLAARENASSERGMNDLQYILADLATKTNTSESTRLAERVQRTLIRNTSVRYDKVKDLGHKEALFFVLLGAKMPAILIETGFVSNVEEEKRLSDGAYQQTIADSIAEALSGYLDERNKLAQVD